MVSFPEIKEYMRQQVEADRNKKSVQVTGATIEEALQQASIELGIPIKKIEYEVLERGSKGALGFGKKDCILIAYEIQKPVEMESFESEDDMFSDFGESGPVIPADMDGEAIVRLFSDGAMLKVTPPKGEGKRVTKKLAVEKLHERAVHDLDDKLVDAVVKEASSEYIKVGEFVYNPVNDAVVSVDITDFEMKGVVVAQPPGPGGADLSYDAIESYLKNNSVIHGIQEDKVNDFVDHPVYNQPITLAAGTPPVHGDDAKVIYNFETDSTKVRLKEKDGKVDFKELNRIQNVVEGQILAKKIPAGNGEDGRTVTGRLLPAKPGKDVELGMGQNVRLSDDKLSLIAECNGQVMLSAGKVAVEPVYIVQGDVNMKVGNIVHLGTVVIKGNVEDGFKVKASGNIEVMGTVGKSELDAEGDIIVHQGITGKTGGNINSGKTVWAKFIENAIVQSGENVVATDGIINSHVDANKKIVCLSRGKRAKIVGGRLRAAEEVIAETFGSVAGSETIIEVGYDPKSKARLVELEGEKEVIVKELEDVNLNISTLAKQRKTRKNLPEEKEKYLKELISKKKELDGDLKNLSEEISSVQNYLASLKSIGKVSAAKRVFPGVKVYIKDAVLEVRSEFKDVTFINEANVVKVTKYEEPEEDYSRKE